MAIEQQNGDYDIYTDPATVYNKTAAADGTWKLDIRIGDGTKDLHTNAATLTLNVMAGGAMIGGGSVSTAKDVNIERVMLYTMPFFAANGDSILVLLRSNNSNDTDVDVTVTPRACVGQTGDSYVDTTELLTRTPNLKIADTTGNWATAGTWADGVVPAAGENIIIRNGVTVTVAANLDLGAFGTLEIQGSGVLNIAEGVTVARVSPGWTVWVNYGTVTANYGTVTRSYGTVTDNDGMVTQNDGIVTANYNTVTRNYGTVTHNYDIVTYNEGTVTNNEGVINPVQTFPLRLWTIRSPAVRRPTVLMTILW